VRDRNWRRVDDALRAKLNLAGAEGSAYQLVDEGRKLSLVLQIQRLTHEGLVENRCSIIVIGETGSSLEEDMAALFRSQPYVGTLNQRFGMEPTPGWRHWLWTAMPPRGSKDWSVFRRDRQTSAHWIIVTDPLQFYGEHDYLLGDLKVRDGAGPRLSVMSFVFITKKIEQGRRSPAHARHRVGQPVLTSWVSEKKKQSGGALGRLPPLMPRVERRGNIMKRILLIAAAAALGLSTGAMAQTGGGGGGGGGTTGGGTTSAGSTMSGGSSAGTTARGRTGTTASSRRAGSGTTGAGSTMGGSTASISSTTGGSRGATASASRRSGSGTSTRSRSHRRSHRSGMGSGTSRSTGTTTGGASTTR
jgi:hypothetical protein